MRPSAWPLRRRHVLVWGMVAVWSACFYGFYHQSGEAIGGLYGVPLVAGGLLLGRKGGLAVGLAMEPLWVGLRAAAQGPWTPWPEAVAYAVMAAGIGFAIGWLTEVRGKLQRVVAERTQAQAALAASEERFRSLVEHGSDLIAMFDLQGRITYASPSVVKASGRAPGDLASVSAFDIVHPDDLPRVQAEIAMAASVPRGAAVWESRIRHADGSWRWVEWHVTNRLDEPSIRALVANGRDVTERRRQEDEERARREALMRNERLASLGTLVAGVAHEINNPLTYMKGNLELALDDLAAAERGAPLDAGAMRLDLARVADGCDRIAYITRSLKVVARQNAAGPPEPVDVARVAEDVAALLRLGLPKGIVVDVHAPAEAFIAGRPGEIHQAIFNLARNAIQAVEGQERGRVAILVARERGQVVASVEDDGPGIPDDVRARLFTPFFTTKHEGTGLGLSITHSIVLDHHGELAVEKGQEGGARFVARFPAASVAVAVA